MLGHSTNRRVASANFRIVLATIWLGFPVDISMEILWVFRFRYPGWDRARQIAALVLPTIAGVDPYSNLGSCEIRDGDKTSFGAEDRCAVSPLGQIRP